MKQRPLTGPTDQATLRAKLRLDIKRPWRKWFKNLLACLVRAHAPTLDAKEFVAVMEGACGGPLAPKRELSSEQRARFMGHLAAMLDYQRESASKILESMAEIPDSKLPSVIQQTRQKLLATPGTAFESMQSDARALPFNERAEFQSALADAYNKTFTPLGKFVGVTDATRVHWLLLKWCILSMDEENAPHTVRELVSRCWHLHPSLKPPVRLDGSDRWEQDIARVQKVCERLGLRFGRRTKTSRKQRLKRASADTCA